MPATGTLIVGTTTHRHVGDREEKSPNTGWITHGEISASRVVEPHQRAQAASDQADFQRREGGGAQTTGAEQDHTNPMSEGALVAPRGAASTSPPGVGQGHQPHRQFGHRVRAGSIT